MNFKHCQACEHRKYDGKTDRCELIVQDIITGKLKTCTKVTATECNQAKKDFAEGRYKTIEEIEPMSLQDIIERSQRGRRE